jgi:hypothetical protein
MLVTYTTPVVISSVERNIWVARPRGVFLPFNSTRQVKKIVSSVKKGEVQGKRSINLEKLLLSFQRKKVTKFEDVLF